jgi:hypothetical protein
MDLAGRRSGATGVFLRRQPVRGWPASGNRRRRPVRRRHHRARRRNRHVRRNGARRRQDGVDPHGRRLLGHARPSRLDRRAEGRCYLRGLLGRRRGAERHSRVRPAVRPPGHPRRVRSAGLRRPAGLPPAAAGCRSEAGSSARDRSRHGACARFAARDRPGWDWGYACCGARSGHRGDAAVHRGFDRGRGRSDDDRRRVLRDCHGERRFQWVARDDRSGFGRSAERHSCARCGWSHRWDVGRRQRRRGAGTGDRSTVATGCRRCRAAEPGGSGCDCCSACRAANRGRSVSP